MQSFVSSPTFWHIAVSIYTSIKEISHSISNSDGKQGNFLPQE